ncbi:anti-sigma factor [Pedobacter sp. HMWF019]|uniref:FecR family protein n=1 Tax=Pedobacter sp. HMWF019 TaxID=2056856 RepID=UPI000D35BBCA|nr:FecR family protein [Pedobacter sp. HMWF019]PTS95214.1 anti-sigma factor [Pedobacter sp. HMWF019]
MKNKRAKKLISRYLEGKGNSKEESLVESWYLEETKDRPQDIDPLDYPEMEKVLWENISRQNSIKYPFKKTLCWSVAAAAVITILGVSLYFMKPTNSRGNLTDFAKTDLPAGGNKAVLTLADGSKIVLEDALKGTIAKQSGILITKTADGQLVYTQQANLRPNDAGSSAALNTIETPKGGQYQINLPDGTKVWLNAASSLSYPARFSGQQRRVILKGEAYFEVAKNKKMPFIVNSERQNIEVLGTHFNVNAYDDERTTKTTLAEGSVKVSLTNNSGDTQILAPGQQAVVDHQIKVQSVDIEEALAWKEGIFMFNNENLESILRKVSRWYNVDIEFQQNQLREKYFTGTVSRFGRVSQILKTLELTESVHFKIEGRKIIVLK